MAIDSEFRFFDLIDLALKRWVLISTICAISICLAVALSFCMTPKYRAEALVIPVDQSAGMNGLGALSGQLGGIAAIAGLSLPNRQDKTEFLATLSSRQLTAALIQKEDMLKLLYGTSAIRFISPSRRRLATMGDALLFIDNSVREVREDPKTGLVTVSIEWYDRDLAAKWANELVAMANDYLRSRAISEAERSIQLLQKEAQQAASIELREAVYRLIESQIKARTIATVHRDYAFSVIDPAVVPEVDQRIRPKRSVMAMAGAVLGFLVGLFVASFLERRVTPNLATQ